MNKDSEFDVNDFEFERKFWVQRFPEVVLSEPSATLIVQNYLVSDNGTALRVRIAANLIPNELSFHVDGSAYSESEVVDRFRDRFNFASVGVKGAPVGGTRYEKEMTVDVNEALRLVKAQGYLVAKQRYGVFDSGDGWNIDVFCGDNYPLMIAECERSGPVVNLNIPAFCTAEVTDKLRFTNDSLARMPFSQWANEFLIEFSQNGPQFRDDFE